MKELKPEEIIKNEFQNAMSKLEKQFDLAYYGIKIILTEYDDEFEKWNEVVLIDTNEKRFCAFCGKETLFYDHDMHTHLCAKCYSDLKEKRNEEKNNI